MAQFPIQAGQTVGDVAHRGAGIRQVGTAS